MAEKQLPNKENTDDEARQKDRKHFNLDYILFPSVHPNPKTSILGLSIKSRTREIEKAKMISILLGQNLILI